RTVEDLLTLPQHMGKEAPSQARRPEASSPLRPFSRPRGFSPRIPALAAMLLVAVLVGIIFARHGAHNAPPSLAHTGTIVEFPLPEGDHSPTSIATGPDGNLWFTELRGLRIGRLTPRGALTEYPLVPATGTPSAIVAGPDGNLWFLIDGTGIPAIGRITPTGTIAQFPVPQAAYLGDLAAGPDGNLWFTE